MAQIKRCKSCRLWRPARSLGTPARNSHVCWLRLREVKQSDGEKVLRPTLQDHDSEPGPHYRKHTGPGFVCKYYVGKHMPVRLPIAPNPLISVDEPAALGEDVSENETQTDGDHAGRRDQVRDGGHA